LPLLLAGCGGGNGTASAPALLPEPSHVLDAVRLAAPNASSGKIQHVVIIVQENRSPDNLFQGLPGADTRSFGYTSSGQKVTLRPIGLEAPFDIQHDSNSFFLSCNGTGKLPGTDCRNNGFDKENVECQSSCPGADAEYAYVPRNEAQPYFDMAEQYTFGDRMFTSMLDSSSFVSHQYIIRANASSTVDYPSVWGSWGCYSIPTNKVDRIDHDRNIGRPIHPCFKTPTLADEMDAAGVSWGYYSAQVGDTGYLWNAFQAIRQIRYGKDWKTDVFTPPTQFLNDVTSGNMRTVSWVTPTMQNSDHAGSDSNSGPSWVTSVVNTIGESKYWPNTAIFIMWDENGAWYDHVKPKMVDYDGLGMRIPLIVISPYAKKGYVSHQQYEHGSILKFVEDQFGLPRLAASDTRANSPEADCFNFNQKPRKFVPIKASLNKDQIMAQPIDRRVPDYE
ncbi:MAG TPA: alkaline phosphatase family protein, partial [Candidatus Tumulicola sp.]